MTHKYKSKFEVNVARSFSQSKAKVTYEPKRIAFEQPAKKRNYTPDFLIHETNLYVECKGRLTQYDREKLIWVKEQNPDLRLVILFQNARVPIRRGSKTSYGDWATKHGFEWADFSAGIPKRWYTKK